MGQEGKAQYIATKMPLMEREVRVETGFLDDAETVIVAFGSPAKFVKYAIRQLRAAGHRIGYVRPITLWPFPYETDRRSRGAVRTCAASAASSSRPGQMIDDVRIGAAGRAPVEFIGGVSTDGSGFGVGRILDVEVDRRTAPRPARRPRATDDPRLRSQQLRAAAPPGGGNPMTTTDLPLGPVIDTSTAPAGGARMVEAQLPDLLLTQEHHMCPGCGEPIAVRQFLETITQLDAVDHAIGVAGIGCYTSFSGTMDVDLVQALHGRAPSVATGVKRMLPDALVFTLQGDGDMVNEGLQEVIHTAARGEKITCILLNNGVFGETGGHMTATSVIGQRTKNSIDGRDAEYHGYPILIGDLIAQLQGAAYVARGSVHNAGAVARTQKMFKRAFESQIAGAGFSFVEVLTMCPTGWFIPTPEGPDYMTETLGEVHIMGELKVDGHVRTTEELHAENVASSARSTKPSPAAASTPDRTATAPRLHSDAPSDGVV